MKCRKCGTIVSLNNMFCPGCGSVISKETISTDNSPIQEESPIYNNTPSGYVPKENLKYTYKPNTKKKNINKKSIYIYSGLAIVLIVGVILFSIFTSPKEIKVPEGYVRIGNEEVGYINVPSDLLIGKNIAINENYYIEMESTTNPDINLQEIIKTSKNELNSMCDEISEKTFKKNSYDIYNLSCKFEDNKGNLYFIEYDNKIYQITIVAYNKKDDISNIINTFNTIK